MPGDMALQQRGWTWFGTFSTGLIWDNGGKMQTFYLRPDIEKTYTADDSTNPLFDGEISIGLQKRVSQTVQGQLGLAVVATSNASLSGSIWEDADPNFSNFFYNYKIRHSHLAVKGKLIADTSTIAQPYLSAAVGVGFNRAYNFTITPKIFEEIPEPPFNSYTTTVLSDTVGLGMQKALSKHVLVMVGGEFADWGKTTLGLAPEQTMGSGLQLNHFYTSGLLFGLGYIA